MEGIMKAVFTGLAYARKPVFYVAGFAFALRCETTKNLSFMSLMQ
jgi:hypothetical protein